MTNEEWLAKELPVMRALKAPSEQQQLLILLADKPDRDAADNRKLAALIRAERAAKRAKDAAAKAAEIIDGEKKAARRARNHAMFQSAGLLVLAGLVDEKTGQPVWDKVEMVGALSWLAGIVDDERRNLWRQRGAQLLSVALARKPKNEPELDERDFMG